MPIVPRSPSVAREVYRPSASHTAYCGFLGPVPQRLRLALPDFAVGAIRPLRRDGCGTKSRTIMTANTRDIVVTGDRQAGLAAGWHLPRASQDFVILDNGSGPGGAWRHGWDPLHLFLPARYGSLPGRYMPPPADTGFPTRDDVIAYLGAYAANRRRACVYFLIHAGQAQR